MSFADKVVLITGAGSGIGKGNAFHFAKLSAKLSLIILYIDVVVNCASRSGRGHITSPDLLDVLDRVLDVNLKSPIALTHYASTTLIESKGCVINISSVIGTFVVKGGIPYAVFKAGMIHFTKCAALELAEKGVRINCLSPGPVNTNLAKNVFNTTTYNTLGEKTPLQYLLKAEEITEMVGYLASDKAKSITGIDCIIDAGMSLQKKYL